MTKLEKMILIVVACITVLFILGCVTWQFTWPTIRTELRYRETDRKLKQMGCTRYEDEHFQYILQ